MEKIIKLTGFSDKEKKDKSGTFPCFEVISEGQKKSIGVFERDAVIELKKHMFEWVKVVMEVRPNGYENITHFVGLAKEDEIPSETELKPERKGDIISNGTPREDENVVRYIHEVITDTRKNSMECGKPGERIKIYFNDVKSFAKQYEEVIIAKRAVDSRLNTDNE